MILIATEYITLVVVTVNNSVIRMVRYLYSNTGNNVCWRGKHQNLRDVWKGANPWGFFHNLSTPAH